MPDGDIFLKAVREDRVVITFDLAFGEILAMSRGQPASVILLRLRNTRTASVIARLRTVIERCGQALEEGAIVVVDDARHRVRRVPFTDQA